MARKARVFLSIHWYAHHLGDYLQKTKHLRLIEHGAYRLLLDYYYSNGGPFRDAKNIIYRVCNAFERAERRAIDRILDQFFTVSGPSDDRVWNHSRADEEISKAMEISDIRRKSGAKAHANAVQKHMQMHTQPQPQPQSSINIKGGRNGKPKTGSEGLADYEARLRSEIEVASRGEIEIEQDHRADV